MYVFKFFLIDFCVVRIENIDIRGVVWVRFWVYGLGGRKVFSSRSVFNLKK